MSNSSPSILGIIRDVGGVSAKLVKLSFKGIGYTARGAHKVLDFAVDATKEGFNPSQEQPEELTQQEFNFKGVQDERDRD
jgi:hypothetical protein